MRALACCAAALSAFAALSMTVGRFSASPEERADGGGGVILLPATASVPASRSAAKQMLADDALAGRRPLAEAAALFRALDAVEPAAFYPDGGGGDAAYRMRVADYARTVVGHAGPAESAAAERLRAEALAGGGAALPDAAGLTPVAELLEAGVRYGERARAEAAARPPSPPAETAAVARGRPWGDRPARVRRDRGASQAP